MITLRFLIYNLLYHCHDIRIFSGVRVYSFWKLKSVKTYKNSIFIPMSKYSQDYNTQSRIIQKYLRKSKEKKLC